MTLAAKKNNQEYDPETSLPKVTELDEQTVTPLIRWRRTKFVPEPGQSVRLNQNKFVLTGSNANLRMTPLKNVKLPFGWVLLKAKFQSDKQDKNFCLAYESEQGNSAKCSAWLSFSKGRAQLAHIPRGAKALCLDIFQSQGDFTLSEIEIIEIGKLQVLFQKVKKYLRGIVFQLRLLSSLISQPRFLLVKIGKAYKLIRRGGISALKAKLSSGFDASQYAEWIEKYDTLTSADRENIKSQIETLNYQPLISIVMPVYNTPEQYLRRAIESVLSQLYTNWELCIADDCSNDRGTKQILLEFAKSDKRIKICWRQVNGHISASSNSALELAQGDFVAMLDHDDELSENALYEVVLALNKNQELDLIYSDEDKINAQGSRFNPHFKSDFNPDLLLAQNYICHLCVFRRELINKLNGFRLGFEGAQDWDLILRVIDATPEKRIYHIPQILYHWRSIEGSTAQATAYKPYVMKAQAKSVKEHLQRRGQSNAEVRILNDISQLRVVYPLPANQPLITLIIATRDKVDYLRRCIDSIRTKTTYNNYNLLIIDNGSSEPATLKYLEELARTGNAQVISDQGPFNFSRINNKAAKLAQGEIIGFLNNDLEVISEDWLSEMVTQVSRPGIGAAGARLLFPNGQLQHAGIILGIGGVAGHNHKWKSSLEPGYFNRAILTQNVSAVTAACMLVHKNLFFEVGGLDENELCIAFNDVDFCLKLRRLGYKIVYAAYAELYHHESISRGYENTPEKFERFSREIGVMKTRWGDLLQQDPYYNVNLTLDKEDFSLAFPPRRLDQKISPQD